MKNFTDINHKNLPLETYGILLLDLCCVVWAYLLAVFLRFQSWSVLGATDIHIIIIFCLLIFCLLYNSVIDYNRGFIRRGYYVELVVIVKRNAIVAVLWGCALFIVQEAEAFSRMIFLYYMVCNTGLNYICHLLFKRYVKRYYRKESNKIKMMVITDKEHVDYVLQGLAGRAQILYEITSVVLWDLEGTEESIQGIPVIAGGQNLYDKARQMPLDEVFLHLPGESTETIETLIRNFEVMGIACHYNIDIVDLDAKTRSLGMIADFNVVTYALNVIDYKHRMIKRAMDLIGSLVGLLVTAVIFPFIAAAIKIESRGPVLFTQVRIGKNGRRFKIYKFRSMYTDAEERKKELMDRNEMEGLMFKMEDDPRVTKVGKFIRKTSIDELPQFYNVFKGDMSLVGTRPPTEAEFEKYDLYYRRRLCMTPGLTGMWQVSGRSDIKTFDEVVRLDLKYIDNWSLSLDIKILMQTIVVVLFRRGAK